MRVRPDYPFDLPLYVPRVRHVQGLWASPDQMTWYVVAGRRSGVRILAHYAPDGQLYIADRLHACCLVRDVRSDVPELLRYAADILTPDVLLSPESVPGFTRTDDVVHHVHGWQTRTERALRIGHPIPPGPWGASAIAWDIADGVYVHQPDGQYWLVRRRSYWVGSPSVIRHARMRG